jgi:tripartite ATP-independent transporter DctP family solute receptor
VKEMLKKLRCLVFVMVLIFVVISCTTFAAVKPVKLVFGHHWDRESFLTKGDLYFKELVEKQSKGQILIDYYPQAQLGNSLEMFQATRSNVQQMTLNVAGPIDSLWSGFGTFNLPYIYRDQAHIINVAKKINSIINQKKFVIKTNLRILNARPMPARNLNTRIPIKSIEKLKGFKIRVPENPVFIAFWKALGTTPTVIPGAELYTALATGIVQGQENPLDCIYQAKFYEQAKYITLTAHMQEIVMMLINNDCWKGLTKAQQKILTNAANQSAKMGLRDFQEMEGKYYNLLEKEGVEFIKIDVTPFRKKAKTMWKQFSDPEFVEKIEAIK